MTWTIKLVLILMALLVILLGFAPGLMDWLTISAGQRLMQTFGY